MDVIHMRGKVAVVADAVLPKTSLPDPALPMTPAGVRTTPVGRNASGEDRLVVTPLQEIDREEESSLGRGGDGNRKSGFSSFSVSQFSGSSIPCGGLRSALNPPYVFRSIRRRRWRAGSRAPI